MRIKRLCNAKKGFSLIEVIIALAILMIVVLGLIGSYYSYYRNMTDLRIQTIGQNLGQLQLEDIQNLPSAIILNNLIGGESYPPNYPAKLTATPPPPFGNKYYNDYGDADYSNVYDSIRYTSEDGYFPQDGLFEIERLSNIVLSEETFTSSQITSSGEIPSGLTNLLLLPDSIIVGSQDIGSGVYRYVLTLNKEEYPNYGKRIVIIDETPTVEISAKKIFKIGVTVYWDIDGDGVFDKSITITGEKNDARVIS